MVCFKCSTSPCGRDSLAGKRQLSSSALNRLQAGEYTWLQEELACGITSVAPLEKHQQAAASLMLTQGFAGQPESPTLFEVQ